MQIIPIDQDEQAVIDQMFAQTSAAKKMLLSISPLASPTRRDSVFVNDANLLKQTVINNLQNSVDIGEEHQRKYNQMQEKISHYARKF